MDIRKLEQLDNFAAFFELLRNPDQYTELIKEAKQAAQDFRTSVLEARKIRDIDAWALERAKALDAREQQIAKAGEDVAKKHKDFETHVEQMRLTLQAEKEAVVAQTKAVMEREKKISDLEKIKKQLQIDAADLADARAKVAVIQQELDAKVTALNAVLKG